MKIEPKQLSVEQLRGMEGALESEHLDTDTAASKFQEAVGNPSDAEARQILLWLVRCTLASGESVTT